MKETKKRGIKDLIEEHSYDKVLDTETIYDVNIEEIIPNPNQPRKHFDEKAINELANSIKEHGIFQPIIIKTTNEGYIIVSGERRYKAAKIAGLTKIPSVIRNYSETKVAEISLVENLQREDLSPIEEAKAYNIIINDLKLTQNELAKRIGKSRSYVTNMLGLLKLPEEIKQMLLEKKLSMGHARVISKLKTKEEMLKFANEILEKKLNVRDTEKLVKNKNTKNKRVNLNRKYKVEKDMLSKYYNAKVSISNDRIVLKLDDEDKINEIIERLIKNAL